ncbi:hypothetical protein [Pantoea ananatis]|uniref:hypothetical protein n=1 Tax=Pantoea ananas TaxID=553 RepID=UPI001B317796|nr:hypothetical protein [Pantoea ananatis]
MVNLIKNWDVYILTPLDYSSGDSKKLVGRQLSPHPNIQQGFLLYENLDGAQCGINITEVLAFSIEPQFIEEK